MEKVHVSFTKPSGQRTALFSKRLTSSGMSGFHQHDDFELACLLTGEGRCWWEAGVYPLEPGRLYVIPPQTQHMMQYDASEPHSLYHIYFRSEELETLYETYGVDLKPYFQRFFSAAIGNELRARLDYALSSYNRANHSAIDQAIQRTLVQCVLLTLAKQIGGAAEAETKPAPPLVQRVLEYIARHCEEPLTLETLSERFRCSKSYLCRLFRQCTGQTVVHYANGMRIQNACRLMEQTNLSLSAVSQLCGFNSLAYFDRQFRQFTGQTPTEYARQHRL